MITITIDKQLEKLGLSMRKFSLETNIRPNTIGELYNGNAKMVSFDILDRVLNGLNDISSKRGLGIRFGLEDIICYEYTNEQEKTLK